MKYCPMKKNESSMTNMERRHLKTVEREQADLVTSTSILMISSRDLTRPSVAFLVIDTLFAYYLHCQFWDW